MPKRKVVIEVDLKDLLSADLKKVHGRIRSETRRTELQTEKSARSMSKSMSKSTSSIGKSIKGLISLQMGMGLSLGFIAKKAFDFSLNFETAMAEVTTISDDVKGHVKSFNKAILDMSKQVPQTALELTKGLYQTISAGVTNTADAMKVLMVASKAATGGLTSTEVAVDAITNVLNAYNLSAKEASHISDLMFTTVKEGKVRFEELAVTVGDISPTAALLGISFEEMAAAMATMTKTGINFRNAATQIRSLMLQILGATDDARAAAKKYGIELSKAGIEKAGGFIKFLSLINEKMGDDVEALKTIFPELRAFRGAAVLAGVQSKELSRILNEMTNSTGASEEAFNTMADTAGEKLKIAINSLNASLSKLGNIILPTVTKGITFLTTVLSDAIDKQKELASNKYYEFFENTILGRYKLAKVGILLFSELSDAQRKQIELLSNQGIHYQVLLDISSRFNKEDERHYKELLKIDALENKVENKHHKKLLEVNKLFEGKGVAVKKVNTEITNTNENISKSTADVKNNLDDIITRLRLSMEADKIISDEIDKWENKYGKVRDSSLVITNNMQLMDGEMKSINDNFSVSISSSDRLLYNLNNLGSSAIDFGSNIQNIAGTFLNVDSALSSVLNKMSHLSKLNLRGILSLVFNIGSLISGGGSILKGIMGLFGGKAEGGMVMPGQAYIVGERGPELFVPQTNGNILPSGQTNNIMNNTFNNNITVSGGKGLDTTILRRELLPAINKLIRDNLARLDSTHIVTQRIK